MKYFFFVLLFYCAFTGVNAQMDTNEQLGGPCSFPISRDSVASLFYNTHGRIVYSPSKVSTLSASQMDKYRSSALVKSTVQPDRTLELLYIRNMYLADIFWVSNPYFDSESGKCSVILQVSLDLLGQSDIIGDIPTECDLYCHDDDFIAIYFVSSDTTGAISHDWPNTTNEPDSVQSDKLIYGNYSDLCLNHNPDINPSQIQGKWQDMNTGDLYSIQGNTITIWYGSREPVSITISNGSFYHENFRDVFEYRIHSLHNDEILLIQALDIRSQKIINERILFNLE